MLVALFCLIPFILVPVYLSFRILNRGWDSPLHRFATLLTLKPLIASVISIIGGTLISFEGTMDTPYVASLIVLLFALPGALVTLLILLPYNTLVMGLTAMPAAQRLLALDTLRWIVGIVVIALILGPIRGNPQLAVFILLLLPLGMALPSIFAALVYLSLGKAEPKLKNVDKAKRKQKDEEPDFFPQPETDIELKAKNALKTKRSSD